LFVQKQTERTAQVLIVIFSLVQIYSLWMIHFNYSP
jgi:hypothetical protein